LDRWEIVGQIEVNIGEEVTIDLEREVLAVRVRNGGKLPMFTKLA